MKRKLSLPLFALLLVATIAIPWVLLRHHREHSRRSFLSSSAASTAPTFDHTIVIGSTIAPPLAFGLNTLFVLESYTPEAELITASAPAAPAPAVAVPGIWQPRAVPNQPRGIVVRLPSFTTTTPLLQEGMAWVGLDGQRVAAFDVWTGRSLWMTTVGRRVEQLTLDDQRLYVAAEEDAAALDADSGRILWSTTPGRRITSALAVSRGRIAFGAADDQLHILDADSGDLLKRIPLGRAAFGRPAVDEGGIACFASGFAVRGGPRGVDAIDLGAGTIRWRHVINEPPAAKGRFEIRGPALADELVVFTTGSALHALDRRTGELRWTWHAPTPSTAVSLGPLAGSALFVDSAEGARLRPILSSPVVYRGVIFIARSDGVFGINPHSGVLVWKSTRDAPPWTWRMGDDYPPAIHRDVIYTVPDAASIRAIDLPRSPSPTLASVTTPVDRAISTKYYLAAGGLLLAALAIAFGLHLRRLVTALACALLAGLLGWAWLDSYNVTHFLGRRTFTAPPGATTRAEHAAGIMSRRGALTFGSARIVWDSSLQRPTPANASAGLSISLVPLEDDPIVAAGDADAADLGLMRFGWVSRSRPSGTDLGPQAQRALVIPHWVMIAALSAPPLAWLTGLWRDRRRYPKGHCRQCGYDLRASPQRCPECGCKTAGAKSADSGPAIQ